MKSPKINQAEDKILDQYLAGKSHLSESYKQIALDLPGVELDSSILAASRREVNARPKSAGAEGWRKWQMPFSIAALLVVSASLTLTMTEHEKKSAETVLAPAPIVVTEESKPSRGDGFGQNATGSVDANKTASPARKIDPIERAKQKMASPMPEAKAPEPKLAQAMKAPAPATAPTSSKPESTAQAFPPSTTKNADAVMQAESKLASVDQARAPQVASRQAASVAAAPASATVTVATAEANVADKVSLSAGAPPTVVAASAPAVAAESSGYTSQPRAARSAGAAAAAPTESSRDAAATSQTLRKSVQLSEADTLAAYSASQTWLAKIEASLREGKTEEAEKTLAEFRKRFPNYIVPDSIKEELEKQRAALNIEPNK
ncbi:MAG: hypothetical protein RL020_1751 [Pseudomonadota bacterium]|jgi:hypothetical protein